MENLSFQRIKFETTHSRTDFSVRSKFRRRAAHFPRGDQTRIDRSDRQGQVFLVIGQTSAPNGGRLLPEEDGLKSRATLDYFRSKQCQKSVLHRDRWTGA